MPERQLTFFDRCILQADQALRTIFAQPVGSGRENPARSDTDEPLSATEKAESISLMRINHAGEVCAQALYQGQALTARNREVRKQMESAAIEENDHLAWCRQRLDELGGHTSYLNPVWYSKQTLVSLGEMLTRSSMPLVASSHSIRSKLGSPPCVWLARTPCSSG